MPWWREQGSRPNEIVQSTPTRTTARPRWMGGAPGEGRTAPPPVEPAPPPFVPPAPAEPTRPGALPRWPTSAGLGVQAAQTIGRGVPGWQEAQARVGTSGRMDWEPVPRPGIPFEFETARTKTGGYMPRLGWRGKEIGPTAAALWQNLKQVPGYGKWTAAFTEAGGMALPLLNVGAEQFEQAGYGAGSGLRQVIDAAKSGAPARLWPRAFGEGYKWGRETVGPIGHTIALEPLRKLTVKEGVVRPTIDERIDTAIRMKKEGATPREIRAEAGDPLSEVAGHIIGDPLILLGLGANTRRVAASAKWVSKEFAVADELMSFADWRVAIKSGKPLRAPTGPLQKIRYKVAPPIPAARAQERMDDLNIINQMLLSSTDDAAERLTYMKAFVEQADPDPRIAKAARDILEDLPFTRSPAGKRSALLMRDAATNPITGKVNFAWADDLIKRFIDEPDQAIQAMTGRYVEVLEGTMPIKGGIGGTPMSTRFLEANAAKRYKAAMDGYIAKWLHLGYNPSYAHRNLANNTFTAFIDGNFSFDSMANARTWADRLQFTPGGAKRGIGAAGIDVGFQVKEIPDFLGTYKVFADPAAWKAGPTLALGQAFEQYNSFRIWQHATRKIWDRSWRYGQAITKSPVIDTLPGPVRKWVLGSVENAMNARELREVATSFLQFRAEDGWKVIDPQVMGLLKEINPGWADELAVRLKAAENIEAGYAQIDDLLAETQQHIRRALADDEAMLHADDIARQHAEMIEGIGIEGADAARTEIAQFRIDRDVARALVQGRFRAMEQGPWTPAMKVAEDWFDGVRMEAFKGQGDDWLRWRQKGEIGYEQYEGLQRQRWSQIWDGWQQRTTAISEEFDNPQIKSLADAYQEEYLHAVMSKGRWHKAWTDYADGFKTYGEAKAEGRAAWLEHRSWTVKRYDDVWTELGGATGKGPASIVGADPLPLSVPKMRQQVREAARAADIPSATKTGAPHPYLMNKINKERRAADFPEVKQLNDLDEAGLQHALEVFEREQVLKPTRFKREVKGLREQMRDVKTKLREAKKGKTGEAAPAAKPVVRTQKEARNLDEYITGGGRDPAALTAADWEQHAKWLNDEAAEMLEPIEYGKYLTEKGRRRGFPTDPAFSPDSDFGIARMEAGKKAATPDAKFRKGDMWRDYQNLKKTGKVDEVLDRADEMMQWGDEAKFRAKAVAWADTVPDAERATELAQWQATRDNYVRAGMDPVDELMREADSRVWALGDRAAPVVEEVAPEGRRVVDDAAVRVAEKELAELQAKIDEVNDLLANPQMPEPAAVASPPPVRATVSAENAGQMQAILEEIRAGMKAAASSDFEKLDKLTIREVERWIKAQRKQLNQTRLVASRTGLQERDFALLNYADRSTADTIFSYGTMYHYWPSRTIVNWGRRMANNPSILAQYARSKRALHEHRKDQPKWWRDQVQIPILGKTMYMNAERSLNPLYRFIEDFEARQRTEGQPFGQVLEDVQNLGIGSPWPVIQWAHALNMAQKGNEEAALAWSGYLGTPTRTGRYATALAGEAGVPFIPPGGFVLEPWLWQGGPFQGGDIWERARFGNASYELARTGEITYEEHVDAAYYQKGPVWDKAMQKATIDRAPGQVISYFLGQGFKMRHQYEVDISMAYDEWYDMLEGIEELAADARSDKFNDFYEQYPWFAAVQMSKKGGPQRDTALVWNVLNRLPPGSALGGALKEAAKIDQDLLTRFYDEPTMESWTDTDRARFMSGILDTAGQLKMADIPTKKEWRLVKKRYAAVWDKMGRKYPNYDGDNNQYWEYMNADLEANARAHAKQTGLYDAWAWKREQVINDELLFAYYGDISQVEQYARDQLRDIRENRWPGGAELSAAWGEGDELARKAITDENPWMYDYWDYGRVWNEYTKMYPPPKPEQAAAQVQLRPETEPVSPTQEAIREAARPLPLVQTPAPAAAAAAAAAETAEPVVGGPGLPAPMPETAQEIEQWRPLIEKHAIANSIDPRVVATIMYIESRGDANAKGKSFDTGLMQVVSSEYGAWATNRPTQEELLDPETNMTWAMKILSGNLESTGGDMKKALALYNAGTTDINDPDAKKYLKLYDDAYEELWGEKPEKPEPRKVAEPTTITEYIDQAKAEADDPIGWVYAHGTAEEIDDALVGAIYDEADRRFVGTREQNEMYWDLPSKPQKRLYLKENPDLSNRWAYVKGCKGWKTDNPLKMGGTRATLTSYVNEMLGIGQVAYAKKFANEKRTTSYTKRYSGGGGYGGGGGGRGRGDRKQKIYPSILKKMTWALRHQLFAYFIGARAALDEGAMNELQLLGVSDVEDLRPLFVKATPTPMTRTGYGTGDTSWRAF